MPTVYAIDGIVPVVEPTTFVHPTAVLIGDVVVGAGCYIGPGAALRGDFGQIVIGRGSSIQDNTTIHSFAGGRVVIGEDCGLGHGAVLHGCTMGDGSLVGMNAVVMDGAEIGAESIVAALAFVRAGLKIPPRSLVAGVPGKIVRTLTPQEIEWKKSGTRDYHRLAARSLASLRAVEALAAPDRPGVRIAVEGSKPLYVEKQAAGG